jgi:hypothetical protein
MPKINSKQKGKTGELELAHILQDHGYDARRTQQFCGKAGDADCVGLPGIHIESKRVEALNIEKAIDQAISDAKNGDMPTVFHRKNRRPWLVTMLLDDWLKLYKGKDNGISV